MLKVIKRLRKDGEDDEGSSRLHPDYEKNLEHAYNALKKHYDRFSYEKLAEFPAMKITPCIDKIHFYLMFSKSYSNDLPFGNYASPVSFNQKHEEYKKEATEMFRHYVSMIRSYNAQISNRNIPRIEYNGKNDPSYG